MEPLIQFTQSLGRCPCHERSDPCARACPWKGCIGPQLWNRVHETVAALDNLRARCIAAAGTPETVPTGSGIGASGSSVTVGSTVAARTCDWDIALTAEGAMADLLAKFHWLEEPPYLVWQAPGNSNSRVVCFSGWIQRGKWLVSSVLVW